MAVKPSHRIKVLSDQHYPFVGVYFQIEVFVVDMDDTMQAGLNIGTKIDLLYEDGKVVHPRHVHSIISVHDSSELAEIDTRGKGKINICINELSLQHDNRRFCLRFRASKNSQLIAPGITPPLLVIRYRLKIVRQPVESWYKDEGGRDNCISVTAMLINSKGQPAHGRTVPIKVQLLYATKNTMSEDRPVVQDEGILTVNNGDIPRIESDGMLSLALKISQVSKSHQNQAFCFKISPDTNYASANSDISPAVTNPVLVYSKRTAKKRKANASRVGKVKSRKSKSSSITKPVSVANPRRDRLEMMKLHQPRFVDSLVHLFNSGQKNAAMRQWIEFAADSLKEIAWQVCGCEVDQEGKLLTSRPRYRCPACREENTSKKANHTPSCVINQAVQLKDTIIREHMKVLGPEVTKAPMLSSHTHSLFVPQPASGVVPDGGVFVPPAMPNLQRQFSSEFLQYFGGIDAVTDNSEKKVEGIFIFPTNSGFPALDIDNNVIGFYKYQTDLVFQATSDIDEDLLQKIKQELSKPTAKIIRKTDYVTLDKLREAALLSYFQLEQNAAQA